MINDINNTELAPILNNINQSKKLLDDKFQKKLIKVIVEDEQFAKEIIDLLNEEYFEGLLPVTIIGYILNYFEKYNTIPNYDTIEDLIKIKETDEITKNHLLEFIKITKEYKLTEKKHITTYTRDFCKKQSLRRGLEDAAKAWEKEDYDSIHKIIVDSMKVGEHRNVGHNYIDDVEKRLIKSTRNPVPFLDGFDYRIGGGLSSGELGIILAATGVGKSMMLVRGATTGLLNGKTVIYYSFELPETSIANRFDSCLTGYKLNSILNYPHGIRDKMEEVSKLGGKLIIKEYPTGTASVNTLRSHIKHLERDGIIPDIIFVDYADIMKTTASFQEKRFALTSIYEGLRALAMELHIPIWTASQAGRAAINESKFDLKVISESLGKAQTADIILGLGRSDDDKNNRKAQLLCLKNRSGEDGYTLELNFDTSNLDISLSIKDNQTGFAGMGATVPTVENSIRKNKIEYNNSEGEIYDNEDGHQENY